MARTSEKESDVRVTVNGHSTLHVYITWWRLLAGMIGFAVIIFGAVWQMSSIVARAEAKEAVECVLGRMESDDFVRKTVPDVVKHYIAENTVSAKQWAEFRNEVIARLDSIEKKL